MNYEYISKSKDGIVQFGNVSGKSSTNALEPFRPCSSLPQ